MQTIDALDTLNLNDNEISDRGVQHLADVFRHRTVMSLLFSFLFFISIINFVVETNQSLSFYKRYWQRRSTISCSYSQK